MAQALDTYSDLDLSDSDSEKEMSKLDQDFKAAADYMQVLVSKLDSGKLLQIYSYYKQATEGPCNIPRPKWYEVQAKQKWDAWNSLGDISPDAAKEKYVAIISELEPKWNENNKENSKANNQHWVTVSSLIGNQTEEGDDGDKTIYDYCKDGDVWQVQLLLKSEPISLNKLDSDGLGLIHWASDRGYLEMIQMLIHMNCDISLRDESGQSALHYAVSCGHSECVRLLLDNGIDKLLKDNDGMTAAELASDAEIKTLL